MFGAPWLTDLAAPYSTLHALTHTRRQHVGSVTVVKEPQHDPSETIGNEIIAQRRNSHSQPGVATVNASGAWVNPSRT